MAGHGVPADDFVGRKFSYLVVGGGTAGLCVAARLSEDPDITVGILEAGAGHIQDPAIDVPGRYGEGIGTAYDWQYETTAQPGLGGRKLPWPRGKVLGGTSALNFMTWNRPNREDLDSWAELGIAGWSWDEMLPYYKKSEKFSPPDSEDVTEHRLVHDPTALGTDGPVAVSYSKEYSPSHRLWHDTLANLNVQTNEAHLSGSSIGAWTTITAVDAGSRTRSYAAPAYYLPNAARPNLVLCTSATVTEVVLENDQSASKWAAKGVRFHCEGKQYAATASEEVIICAGSVASPQLLELSGIGSPSVLEAAGTPVKISNPNVGEHLQDHIMTATIYEIDPSVPNPDTLRNDPVAAAMADHIYATTKGGPRTILPVSLCYLPLTHFVSPSRLSSLAERASTATPRDIARKCRLEQAQRLGQIEYIFDVGNWSTTMPPEKASQQEGRGKKAYATLLQILQYPFSLGSIHISPHHPHGKPIIDPQYYAGAQGPLDLEIQELCAQFGQKIVDTPPLRDFVQRRVWPPENLTEEEELRTWIVENTVTDWHPVGTCSMGGREGSEAGVVDERLRVYGVEGLRVVDASVMPLQIGAHLQATVYAIAEKAGDMIREDRRR
ncbi:uncharacterized protein LTR77_010900 [Saxophila tyrrhenica]|uniref:Glucose-methanol-choline oxidoreductase N-terminal domain-containing protein n=1 Tax=Saxophila tyrrhenica TaxID=1690608 RepID=A0AAV9NTY3_9PEZI|nr:hypothetical protein LTR77_010900 [Saxophila tyrrhenica]